MEYFAVYPPSNEDLDAETLVFESRLEALKVFKSYKDARFKSFKTRAEALKFARNGTNPVISILDSILKSPPPNQPPMRNLEKSNFPAPKSQDLVKFRKEIEQNNVQKVYELICTNPRYLVSSGDTPSILKEGPRYNALHVAAMNKHAKMAKLILQTVEQTEFIERLHGFKDDPNIEVMTQFLLESYLNTPDKSRNETPLHFAAKIGAVDVIEVLISYPLCKMKPNSEGLYPKDIICARAPADTPTDVKKAIEDLLQERYFVPVLRSTDNSVQPKIGEPFTPANMPKFNNDPMSPTVEIKAYAGPMTSEQAHTFCKRWKTPPRLIPSGAPGNLNTSFSPKSSLHSTPVNMQSPRMSKSLTEMVSSTPKLKKKLFQNDDYDESDEIYLNNINEDKNGNHKLINGILGEHEEDEYKELFDDLMESKKQMEIEKSEKDLFMFQGYRNPNPIMDTPVRAKNDSNSNHLNHNFNHSSQRLSSSDSMFCNVRSGSSAALMTYLDESGSIYNSDSVFDSPSFKEKNIRLIDTEKGLEKVGRELATDQNVGWKEYWSFLNRLVDIRSDEGLSFFENFLKRKQLVNELKESSPGADLSPSNKLNESFGLGAVCAGLYSMDLNDISDKSNKFTRNGLTSPSNSISRMSLLSDFSQRSSLQNSPLMNPYTCFEQNCRTYSKRLASLLKSETIQDQHSYEKTLLQEISGLNSSIDNYKRDLRFKDVNFKKVHARYSFLLVWYLNQNNIEVKYLRNFTPLIRKVHALASQYTTDSNKDMAKNHAVCLSSFISKYIEKCDKIFNPENVNTETACISAWNGPDIVECACSFEGNLTSSKHRREIRKKLYCEKSSLISLQSADIWAARIPQASDDDDDNLYLSCSDSESESDEYLTPPQSPTRFDSDDDDMIVFEESLETFEEEKGFTLFIEGEEPVKVDNDVFEAIGETFVVDETKYQLVSKWHAAMKVLCAKACQNSVKNNFRIFTPKLKIKSRFVKS